MTTCTEKRFDIHLIADADLQDIIRFHERQASRSALQFSANIWRERVCEGYAAGQTAGRGEASRLLFVGGVAVGFIFGLILWHLYT